MNLQEWIEKEKPINNIVCCDCLEGMKQIKDNSIDLVVIDPPYNVGIADWDIIDNYKIYLKSFIDELIRVLKPNKALYIFGNQHSISKVKEILDKEELLVFRSLIIWNKGVGIPNPNNFTNLHEQILYYIKGPNKKILNIFGNYIKSRRIELNLHLKEIGTLCDEKWYHRGGHLYFETGLVTPTVAQYIKLKEVLKLDNTYDIYFDNHFVFNLKSVGIKWKYEKDSRNKRGWKNCGDVWNIPQLSGTFKERLNHPTQKPLSIIKRIINVSSNEKDIILDCFMGSGTTAVACKQLGRDFIGFEISPEYCAIANKRLKQSNINSFLKEKEGKR